MSKMRVAITRPIHEAGLVLLGDEFDVDIHADEVMSLEDLKEFSKGANALITLLTDKVNDEVLEFAGEQLKVIAQYAVGMDNIDVEAAKKRGIAVTNTPGNLSGVAVAEQALNFMFALARHTVSADAFMRGGEFQQWDPNLFLGQQLTGKTVGIIGSGQIGSLFAATCHNGLKMRVIYSDVNQNTNIEKDLGATKVGNEQLFKEADVISIHVPLLPATQHLINEEALNMMKPTTILINTSRGPVVDENALVKALHEKKIYGAGLDVFEFEPKMAEGLAALENVVVSPHIGSATEATRIAMGQCVARNVIAVLHGEAPLNPVK